MSEHIKSVLIEAINDEYKARATYQVIINKFGEIRPFINIIEAETRHISALIPLFNKYGIPVPKDNWMAQVSPPASVKAACEMGVEAEILNGEMYDRLIASSAGYPDVQRVLQQLQRASIENHLPAFQRCATRRTSRG